MSHDVIMSDSAALPVEINKDSCSKIDNYEDFTHLFYNVMWLRVGL